MLDINGKKFMNADGTNAFNQCGNEIQNPYHKGNEDIREEKAKTDIHKITKVSKEIATTFERNV
jgi:hypothetical protein